MTASAVRNSPTSGVAAVLRRHWAVVAALGLLLLTGLAIVDDYGRSPYENVHGLHGAATVDYVIGQGDAIFGLPFRSYGMAFELPLTLVERAARLEDSRAVSLMRHVLMHLLFLAGGLSAYLLAQSIFKNKLIALLCMLLFLLHPRLYAHSFMNSKDIPFASMVMIVLFLARRAFGKDTLWAFALLGAGVGTLANIRVFGMLFVPVILAMRGFDLPRASGANRRNRILLSSGVFVLAAGLTLYASWPLLWSDPVGQLIESAPRPINYGHDGTELFRGQEISTIAAPAAYIPTWFSLTAPPFALLLGAIGAAASLRVRSRGGGGLLMVGGFAAPIAAVILLGVTVYDTGRLLYFLWAPFSLLAGFGLHWLIGAFKQARLRGLAYGAAWVGVGSTAISMVFLHPNQQVYFNVLEDRNKPGHLSERYDMDYWRPSMFSLYDHLLDEESSGAALSYENADLRMLRESDRSRLRLVNPSLADFSIRTSEPEAGEETLYTVEAYNSTLAALVREQPQENPFPAIYEAAVSGNPIARSGFDLYLRGRGLTFVKEPCATADLQGAFFLRFYRADPNDLPDDRQMSGYGETKFRFLQRGSLFDGKCVGHVPLPDYPVLNVEARQFYPYGNKLYWEHLFPLDADRRYAAYESAINQEPDIRAAFALYLDEEARTLTYVREPCGLSDAERKFFAHVVPLSVDDLPAERRDAGFDNMDFHYLTRGIVFDGKCVAVLPLPEYGIASIRTGQFTSGEGEVWNAAVPFSAGQARRQ